MLSAVRFTRGATLATIAALTTVPAAAQTHGKQPISVEDYGKWEQLGAATLSNDGKWIAYGIGRSNDEDELRIRLTARDSLVTVPYGRRPVFSKNSRWLAYAIDVSESERKRLEREKKPIRSRVGYMDLASGTQEQVADVRAFALSDVGPYLAMHRYAPSNSDRTAKGTDVVVRDLTSGIETNFGNVSEFEWQENGPLLALVIDADGKAGNGVQLYDPAAGTLRTLDSDTARYHQLAWREKDDDLVVLKARIDSAFSDTAHVVLAWENLTDRRPQRRVLDPASTSGFPEGWRVVHYRAPRWAETAGTIYVGIQERTPTPPKPARDSTADSTEAAVDEDDDEPPTVEVWHAQDVDIVPQQKVRAQRDREENYLAAWHVADGRFVQLGSEQIEDVRVLEGDRVAVGTDRTPYDTVRMFGPLYRDVYRIDVTTGRAEKILERIQYLYGGSPGARYVLYLENDHYWTYDLATSRKANMTESVPTSFVDIEDDHTVEQKPPFGRAGWTTEDRSVLLYDKYDVWQVQPDGSAHTRLTSGAADSTVHRYLRLDPDEEHIDLSRPVYLSLYGEWTKHDGFGRLARGRVERLAWQPRNVSRLAKADSADVYAYVVQDFGDSPDYFVGGPDLTRARQVTRTNPFHDDYAWGDSELIEYENTWGRRLQGALFYPANYEPGRQYPMIVYIYEIRSPSVHRYSVPSEQSAYNPAVWTSQGYFVLQPDIVYRDRDPGRSAVAAIVPAVERVLETGMVDRARVGLVGHSWGGYQTSFVVTQTDIFAAAVAGAPLTNLVSMYLSVYWNTGGTDARIFEISQGRMEVPFWRDLDAYMANSPVFHVENLKTPLLVAHGTEDGAVDFNQGVEYYNAARRAGKEFVLLVYEGENHSNAKKPNRIDYHHRIVDWFGHYLKGEPAPQWIAEGVRYLDLEKVKEKKDQQANQGG